MRKNYTTRRLYDFSKRNVSIEERIVSCEQVRGSVAKEMVTSLCVQRKCDACACNAWH